jgi:hypothetical protein
VPIQTPLSSFPECSMFEVLADVTLARAACPFKGGFSEF